MGTLEKRFRKRQRRAVRALVLDRLSEEAKTPAARKKLAKRAMQLAKAALR